VGLGYSRCTGGGGGSGGPPAGCWLAGGWVGGCLVGVSSALAGGWVGALLGFSEVFTIWVSKKTQPWISDLEVSGNRRGRPACGPPAKPAGRGPAWVPINGARGRRGHSAYPWPAPATRRLVVAWFPGLLWEVLPGALGGQVRRITSAPTTQGGASSCELLI
jgi:hypothetical protein